MMPCANCTSVAIAARMFPQAGLIGYDSRLITVTDKPACKLPPVRARLGYPRAQAPAWRGPQARQPASVIVSATGDLPPCLLNRHCLVSHGFGKPNHQSRLQS